MAGRDESQEQRCNADSPEIGAELGLLGQPGYYPGPPGELGTWVLHVPGGGALAANVVQLLGPLAASRPERSGSRDVLMRLINAFVEASPDYGE